MSFTPHNYRTGELIQATPFNELEQQVALNEQNINLKVDKITKVNGHTLNQDVTITKSDVGLGNVDNTSDADKPISSATQTALDSKVPATRTINGYTLDENVALTKSDIGLGNVDNTSDANKPVSSATQTALNTKMNIANPSGTGDFSITGDIVVGANGDNPVVVSDQTILDETGQTIITKLQGIKTAIENGIYGKDGEDGFSPSVTVSTITGGHSVKITDKLHPSGQTFNVMDGETPDISNKLNTQNPVFVGRISNSEAARATGNHGVAAIGNDVEATGDYSAAFGHETHANGDGSFAQGFDTTASNSYAHAEGYGTLASGNYGSHSEGNQTEANGTCSHAEGFLTVANGHASHAEGEGTLANCDAQHTEGRYNIADNQNKYVRIVGNGEEDERHDAERLDWDGNLEIAGDLTINGCGGTSPVAVGEKLATYDASINTINQAILYKADKTYVDLHNARQDRVMENVRAALVGKAFTYEDDTTSAYQKTLPAGVLPNGLLTMLGGKTIVWNQLVKNGNFSDSTGWTRGSGATLSIENNVATITRTSGTNCILYTTSENEVRLIDGHRYLMVLTVQSDTSGSIDAYTYYNDTRSRVYYSGAGARQTIYSMFTAVFADGEDRISAIRIRLTGGTNGDTFSVENVMFVNLTQMFGSTVADTMTYEEFKAMFPSDYYPYSAPTVLSADVVDIKQVGKNHFSYSGVSDIVTVKVGTNQRKAFVFRAEKDGIIWNSNVVEQFGTVNLNLFEVSEDGTTIGTSKTIYRSVDPAISNGVSFNANKLYAITASTNGTEYAEYYIGGLGFQIEYNPTKTEYKPYKLQHHQIPAAVQALEGYGQTGYDIVFDTTDGKWYYVHGTDRQDITALMPEGFHILTGLESGGSLTFVNSHGDNYRIPVPSTESYEVSVQEVLTNG